MSSSRWGGCPPCPRVSAMRGAASTGRAPPALPRCSTPQTAAAPCSRSLGPASCLPGAADLPARFWAQQTCPLAVRPWPACDCRGAADLPVFSAPTPLPRTSRVSAAPWVLWMPRAVGTAVGTTPQRRPQCGSRGSLPNELPHPPATCQQVRQLLPAREDRTCCVQTATHLPLPSPPGLDPGRQST